MGKYQNDDLIEVFEDTRRWCRSEKALRESVERSLAETKLYSVGEELHYDKSRYAEPMAVSVSTRRTFEAARELHEKLPNAKIAVLNFASATNPGGGVARGSRAQEESLCRCSTLYPVLADPKYWGAFYGFHRKRHDARYTDLCLYTPGVKVIKSDTALPERLDEKDWLSVDIITCAAPNLRERPSNEMNPQAGEALHLSDEELLERVQELKIMSRARPLDKQRLVKLLQQRGEVVAVTGDGTNDAPALNFANVGLSMGSGTSVAKDASDITLLDDSFASIATAVMWGRSLYRNIQRFVLFQLTINFAAITICFIGAVFGTEMPLTVVQILWVNIIMDTFAAMAMASLPPSPEVMRDKPRPRDEFIITPAMARTLFTCGTAMVVVLLGMLFRWTILQGGLTVEQLTVFFSTFVFLQFWNMFNAKGFETRHSVFTCLAGCREFFLILAAIGVGQVLIVEFGGEVFRTEPLSWMQWAEVIGFTSLLAVGGEAVRAIRRKRQ